jgi:transposase
MPKTASAQIAVIGIDIGENSFHIVGHDKRGSIVLRQKWSRGQIEARLANLPPSLVGMEACVGAHHLARKLTALGHDARQGINQQALDREAPSRRFRRQSSQQTIVQVIVGFKILREGS